MTLNIVAGIENAEKVRTDLFNNLNNRAKVSSNLLGDQDVKSLTLEGKTVLMIRIPPASRKHKPVFLNAQPLGHTYRRLHDGDRHCDEETVKRMLAEQLEDSRDHRILHGFSLADLNLDSLHAYRNALAPHRPDHPWITPDDAEFLRLIGGWREDRYTGEKGVTLAGWEAEGRTLRLFDTFEPYDQTLLEMLWGEPSVADPASMETSGQTQEETLGQTPAETSVQTETSGQTPIETSVQTETSGQTPIETSVQTETSGQTPMKTSVQTETSGQTPSKTSAKILALVRENPSIKIFEMALLIGVTERSIERSLKKLQNEQILSRVGPTKGGHWKANQ